MEQRNSDTLCPDTCTGVTFLLLRRKRSILYFQGHEGHLQTKRFIFWVIGYIEYSRLIVSVIIIVGFRTVIKRRSKHPTFNGACRVHTKCDGAARLHTKSMYRRVLGTGHLERVYMLSLYRAAPSPSLVVWTRLYNFELAQFEDDCYLLPTWLLAEYLLGFKRAAFS